MFAALEILKNASPYDDAKLFYWHREAKNSNFEESPSTSSANTTESFMPLGMAETTFDTLLLKHLPYFRPNPAQQTRKWCATKEETVRSKASSAAHHIVTTSAENVPVAISSESSASALFLRFSSMPTFFYLCFSSKTTLHYLRFSPSTVASGNEIC